MSAPNARLSAALADRYRIERELGAGGMATVYLAHDLRHERPVAIKVLKPELAAVLGADRFVVEIKTTASLSHPHILPLFDSGSADGFLFYVMPFIDGETLRARLDREAQLGVDEAIRIATEVADALDYAHRRGVVHRDIKPENILLHDGRPMVADFGIALAVSAAAGGRMTETGLSLGTPHYMSPEQATAEREISGRSDVYSLASVLYEMLSGEPPHMGNSAQQIIMKIIADTPRPLTELRRTVPAHVAAAVAKALEKIPADRFESAKAFAAALHDAHFTVATTGTVRTTARAWWKQPASMAALLTIAVLGTTLLLTPTSGTGAPPTAEGVTRLSFVLEDSTILSAGEGGRGLLDLPSVSPDNRAVLLPANTSKGGALIVRLLDSFASVAVAGDNASFPFFSHDGKRVGFFRESDLWTVSLDNRDSVRLATLPEPLYNVAFATWHPDGRVLVAAVNRLYAIPASGDSPTLLATIGDKAPCLIDRVRALTSGDILLNCFQDGAPRIEVLKADGTGRRQILESAAFADVIGDVLIIEQQGSVRASRFDVKSLEPVGPSIAIDATRKLRFGSSLARVRLDSAQARQVVFRRADGSIVPVPGTTGTVRWPRLSPNGRLLAFGLNGTGIDGGMRVVDLTSGLSWPLRGRTEPTWTPDNSAIIMSANEADGAQGTLLVRERAAGGGAIDTLLRVKPPQDVWPTDVSRDGAWLAFYGARRPLASGKAGDDRGDIGVLNLMSREVRYLTLPGFQRGARFSPDGQWIAYMSAESEQSEVFVRAWPALDRATQVSRDGGEEPVWSVRGDSLYFRRRDDIMAVTINASGGAFASSAPARAFAGGQLRDQAGDQSYDIAPDGRFVFVRVPPRNGRPIIVDLELNWIADIRARLDRAK